LVKVVDEEHESALSRGARSRSFVRENVSVGQRGSERFDDKPVQRSENAEAPGHDRADWQAMARAPPRRPTGQRRDRAVLEGDWVRLVH